MAILRMVCANSNALLLGNMLVAGGMDTMMMEELVDADDDDT